MSVSLEISRTSVGWRAPRRLAVRGFFVMWLFAGMWAISTPTLRAATFLWTDSSTDFNSSTSWFLVGGGSGAPGINDRGLFYQASFGNSPNITASTSVGGIELVSGGGALIFSAASSTTLTLGSSGLVNYSSNSLTMNSGNLSLALNANSTFVGDGTISLGSSLAGFANAGFTLTLDGTGTGSAIGRAISGTGGLVKSGTGTWALDAANSYTGTTTVDTGVLRIGAGSNASSAVTVNVGGTLQLAAANAFSSPTLVTLAGGTIQVFGGAFNQSFGAAPLSLAASSTFDFGTGLGATAVVFGDTSGQTWIGTLLVSNFSTAGGDTLRFGTSNTALTGGQLAAISFDGIAAQIDGSGFVTPVPEPEAIASLLGAASLAWFVWRRRQRVSAAAA